jgi:hypothetical protein
MLPVRMRVSYRVSLIEAIPALVLATGGIIATRTFSASRDTVRGLADDLFREVAQKTVERTQSHLARAVPAIELLALLAKEGTLAAPGRDPDQVGRQLLPVLQANPGFSWVTYSERDGAFAGVYRTADGKVRLNTSRIVDGKTTASSRPTGAGDGSATPRTPNTTRACGPSGSSPMRRSGASGPSPTSFLTRRSPGSPARRRSSTVQERSVGC